VWWGFLSFIESKKKISIDANNGTRTCIQTINSDIDSILATDLMADMIIGTHMIACVADMPMCIIIQKLLPCIL